MSDNLWLDPSTNTSNQRGNPGHRVEPRRMWSEEIEGRQLKVEVPGPPADACHQPGLAACRPIVGCICAATSSMPDKANFRSQCENIINHYYYM